MHLYFSKDAHHPNLHGKDSHIRSTFTAVPPLHRSASVAHLVTYCTGHEAPSTPSSLVLLVSFQEPSDILLERWKETSIDARQAINCR